MVCNGTRERFALPSYCQWHSMLVALLDRAQAFGYLSVAELA